MNIGMRIGACLLAAGLAMAAEPVRVKLDLVRLEDPGAGAYSDYGYESLRMDKKSKTNLVVPEGTGKSLLFGVLPLKGAKGGYAFALAKDPDSGWYEELWIDSNEDGTVGPDERFVTRAVVKPEIDVHPAGARTPVVSTFVVETPFGRAAGVTADYAFELQVQTYKGYEDNLHVRFLVACCRKGRAVIHGKSYDVTLMDLTLNGRFNDLAKQEGAQWRPGDGLVFVPGGEANPQVAVDIESLSALRVVGEDIYQVSTLPDGSEMQLTASDIARGYLTMKPIPERVDLVNELGFFRVRRSESALLPAATYWLTKIDYEMVVDDGTQWVLWGYCQQVSPKVEIKPGKKTKMPFGAPFTSRVTYTLGWQGSIPMKVELRGQGGEVYSYHHATVAGDWMPTADVIVRARGGKVLAQVKRSVQVDVDAVPPDYLWDGPVPKDGAVATCDLGLPWKVEHERTMIMATEKEGSARR